MSTDPATFWTARGFPNPSDTMIDILTDYKAAVKREVVDRNGDFEKLWKLRGEALKRPCIQCGYKQQSIIANEPHKEE